MLARLRKMQEEREGGFTLIELLVVIIIIGILAAVAIPVFLNQRKKGYDAQAKSDVRNAATAEETYLHPRRETRAAYVAALDRLHLDGLVYPAAQMPPPDETMPQDGKLSGGPHSETGWVNKIGVPAIALPAGFYPNGLPFGLEMSARPWRDGDLLGWAYSFEQTTKLRHPPTLVESGLTTAGPYRQ